MRISDWSSDVCSSDLAHGRETALLAAALALLRRNDGHGRPIRSAASYLGGMLRQSPGVLNPVPSLTPLLTRSEEHTSEPVTNAHLVCRLLLEKKINNIYSAQHIFSHTEHTC